MAETTPQLIPAIDLRGGRVVRLTRGDYDRQTTYDADPLDQAKRFADAGASRLHVVDLDGARTGELTHADVIESVCQHTPLKVEVGGGVRDEKRIDALLELGVDRVILGTAALKHWDWFASLVPQAPYRGRLVLGLDAKDGYMATDGWESTSEAPVIELARQVAGWPLAAVIYTDIATDGTLAGPNVELTRQMTEATDVPIIASGGVGTLDHLRRLRELDIAGAIVGKALYENAFTIEEALAAFEGKE